MAQPIRMVTCTAMGMGHAFVSGLESKLIKARPQGENETDSAAAGVTRSNESVVSRKMSGMSICQPTNHLYIFKLQLLRQQCFRMQSPLDRYNFMGYNSQKLHYQEAPFCCFFG